MQVLSPLLVTLQPVLASGGGAKPPAGEILGLLAWIVALAVGAAIVAGCLRFWLKGREDDAGGGIGLGFTLADLREMRDRGQLDEEEFAAAREKLLRRDGAGGGGDDPPARPAAGRHPPPPPEDPPEGVIVWDDPPQIGPDR